ncbi:8201_t:CDS:2, partial [Funneliformis caledonium]
ASETAEQRKERFTKERALNDKPWKQLLIALTVKKSKGFPIETGLLSESDRKLLQEFRSKINKVEQKLCPTYNEHFPSIKLDAIVKKTILILKKFAQARGLQRAGYGPADISLEFSGPGPGSRLYHFGIT